MWIAVHLQKCQAIKLPHVNEVILIRIDGKKCIDFFSLAVSRQIMLNHSIIRTKSLVFSSLKCDIYTPRIDLNTWNEF